MITMMLGALQQGSVRWLLACLAALLLAGSVNAQAAQTCPATQDDVNRVASSMYCPVCENIPLDACGTSTCIQWQNEIRLMLEQCATQDQIVADFVTRFGDRVVGIPQDPTLRALSLVTPWVLGVLALIVGVMTFVRWSRLRSADTFEPLPFKWTPGDAVGDLAVFDETRYRQQLEEDLKRRR